MNNLREAVTKLAEAARLLVEHAPPGEELENAEAKVLADQAKKLVEESEADGIS